jgi:hypothetical protein
MATDARVAVRGQIDRLKQKISQKGAELKSLKNLLDRNIKAYKLLAGDGAIGNRSPRRTKRRVNWSSVLNALPHSFTKDDLTKVREAKPKPRDYLSHVLLKWLKERKVKRTGRGKYQKASSTRM